MIYWISDAETGRKLEGVKSYEEAIHLQNKYWADSHIDTFIEKENYGGV